MSEEKELLKELWIDEESQTVTITLHGYKVECLPELQRVVASQASTTILSVPTYTYQDVAGEEITKEFDQEGIDDPRTSDEDKAAWAEYLAERDKVIELNNELLMRELTIKCIVVHGLPETEEEWDAWIEERKFLRPNEEIPASPMLRKYKFIRDEVVSTGRDVTLVIEAISKAHGASEEVLRQLEDSFRAAMERQAPDAGADQEESPAEPGQQGGGVGSSDVHGGAGEEVGGDTAPAVA